MRFNLFSRREATVTNYAGAVAYSLSPETELYAAVVTAGLSDTFYEKSDTRIDRIRGLMQQVSPEYVAKLAVYARTEMYMRSIPMVLAVELAKNSANGPVIRKAVAGVVKRADEITELLAFYQLANKRTGVKRLNKLSKQVQKGLSDAFNTFDEYQFAKYDRDGEIKLRDALFIVHPVPKSEGQQAVFNKIAAGELATPYTWETELSALGQLKDLTNGERETALREKWEELIDSGKLGYMAMLRNLRNILAAGVSAKHIKKVCDRLADKSAVAKSKQLPFRFLAAYREVREMQSGFIVMVLDALEAALAASVCNLRGFSEHTRVLIACDVSGSMQHPISPKSKVLLYDIGLVLAMLMQSKCLRVVTGMFGDKWKTVNMPGRNILANVQEFYRREGEVGYSTNGYKVIDDLVSRREVVDKVMLFTDCQMWDSTTGNNSLARSWEAYKRIAPGAKLYLFDLAGHGATPLAVRDNDVYLLAGWSDKVFDVLQAIEDGGTAVAKINSIVL